MSGFAGRLERLMAGADLGAYPEVEFTIDDPCECAGFPVPARIGSVEFQRWGAKAWRRERRADGSLGPEVCLHCGGLRDAMAAVKEKLDAVAPDLSAALFGL